MSGSEKLDAVARFTTIENGVEKGIRAVFMPVPAKQVSDFKYDDKIDFKAVHHWKEEHQFQFKKCNQYVTVPRLDDTMFEFTIRFVLYAHSKYCPKCGTDIKPVE